jgi:hypothetical protein
MATSVVTFEKAQNAVSQAASNMNRKIVEQVPEMIKRLSKENRVYIFNVGMKPHSRSLGSLGTYFVPARKEGQEVSDPLIIDGLVQETIPDGGSMNKMNNRYEEGMTVAMDVMFIGRGYDPMLNRQNYGLFISDSPTPSKAAIREAKANLRSKQQKYVDEADVLESQNKRADISEMHRDAARALGVVKAWLSEAPREASNCPACQKLTDIEAVTCTNCGAVLDWEKAKIYFPEKYLAYKQAQA